MNMCKKNIKNKGYIFLFLLAMVISALTGCLKDQNIKLHEQSREISKELKRVPGLSFKNINVQPIEVTDGVFYRAEGWIDNDSIVYLVNKVNGSSIFTHNLNSGESILLFETLDPVVTIKVSPLKDLIFIHTSPSTYAGKATVIDLTGKVLFTAEVPSTELTFEWNPYNENLIALTAFKEDWTYDFYLIDIKEQALNKMAVPEPFVNWLSEDEFVFLSWDTSSPAFYGTVAKSDVGSLEVTPIGDETFRVFGFKDMLMYINVIPPDAKEMIYTFLNNKLEVIQSFNTPNLTRFSDWLVPEFDFLPNRKSLLTFRPHKSGEADIYNEGFDLVEFHVESGDEEIYFSDLQNEPIQCSPDGTLCLYGFQLEKLIILEEKQILKLVQE